MVSVMILMYYVIMLYFVLSVHTVFALIFVGLIFHEYLKKVTLAILFLLLPKLLAKNVAK